MREKALKVVLVIVGLFFVGLAYPMIAGLRQPRGEEGELMLLSIYATLGIFLLLAVPNPSAHRSLIAFTGWSSLAHAAVMAAMVPKLVNDRVHMLIGVALFGVIGLVVLAVAPRRTPADQTDSARARAA